MGLMVHSLSEFPINAEKAYYLYVLRGSWDGEIEQALMKNFNSIADSASRGNAVAIFGTSGHHFYNDVFSWHHINGEEAESLLPAILITTIHPAKFRDENDPFWEGNKKDEFMILIPLSEAVKKVGDLTKVLRQIFADCKKLNKLKEFEVYKTMQANRGAAFMDAVILQPNAMGFGFDLKKIPSIIRGK